MRKSLLLILLVISSLICSAQLQIKEGSFKKVDGFVNINTEKMFDDNDRPYAVLKIKTENINDKQRRELSFGGDAQTFFEAEYKDGEVWLYISYYATFLKISHPDLSSTEFWFPFDMEPKRGYELTLINKPALDEEIISRIEKLENSKSSVAANPENYGYIVINTGSLEGATVFIDGNEMAMKTPFVSDPIQQGPHKIKVVMDGYEAYQDILSIEGKKITTVNCDLKKDKTVNPYRNKGFVLVPEISIALEFNSGYEFLVQTMPKLNIEYMFDSNIGVGLGVGSMALNYDICAIPIYGQMTYNINDRKIAPYINVRIGYTISLGFINDNVFYNSENKVSGVYGSGCIGVNIYHSRIGLIIDICDLRYKNASQYESKNIDFIGVSYSYMIPF